VLLRCRVNRRWVAEREGDESLELQVAVAFVVQVADELGEELHAEDVLLRVALHDEVESILLGDEVEHRRPGVRVCLARVDEHDELSGGVLLLQLADGWCEQQLVHLSLRPHLAADLELEFKQIFSFWLARAARAMEGALSYSGTGRAMRAG
jgi:hypothetical protein